jgi:hypothetical protein
MIPDVDISVLTSQVSDVGIAANDKDLGTAYFFTPCCLESLSIDDAKFSLICSENQIVYIMIS